MASTKALCRIRVKDTTANHTRICTLDNCLELPAEIRLQWAKAIEEKYCRRTQSDHYRNIRDWDLVLDLDGSVENIADNPYISLPSTSLFTTKTQQKEYPAHYQIPQTVTAHLDLESDKTNRTELFALGSLIYELSTSRNPFHNRSDEEVQSLYAEGNFPDDIWILPSVLSILCCWCPGFANELQQDSSTSGSLLGRASHYIRSHPGPFSLQVLGGVVSIAALVTVPILGAVGFAAAGPVAGSAAAAWQGSIGLVQAGSLFAWCQSAAMGGAAVGGIVATGVAGGTVAAGATIVGALDAGSDGNPVPVLKERFTVAWNRQISTTAPKQELSAHANHVAQREEFQKAESKRVGVNTAEKSMEMLQEREICTHHDWKYVSGAHRCEECMRRLPQYIFKCRQCQSLACNRCRRR